MPARPRGPRHWISALCLQRGDEGLGSAADANTARKPDRALSALGAPLGAAIARAGPTGRALAPPARAPPLSPPRRRPQSSATPIWPLKPRTYDSADFKKPFAWRL